MKHTKRKLVEKGMLGIGVIAGYFLGMAIGEYMVRFSSLGARLAWLLGMLLGAVVLGYAQIAIHEAGHLVFGLLTGYRFLSYRVGALMLLREKGRLVFRWLTIAGTGGQCLLIPPPLVDGKIPYALYTLGGAMANLAAALLFGLAWLAARDHAWLGPLGLIGCVMGLLFALTNGIPARVGGIDNDGRNALSLRKNPAALVAFWMQMQIHAALVGGTRLRDMPDDWFCTDEADLRNAMTASIAVFACNRWMDAHDFVRADAEMATLTQADCAIVGLYRSLLVCDRIWCALMAGERDRAAALNTPAQGKFMRTMKHFPSVMRTAHAQALLGEGDLARAEEIEARFARVARRYPYPVDILSERELIELAKEKANANH